MFGEILVNTYRRLPLVNNALKADEQFILSIECIGIFEAFYANGVIGVLHADQLLEEVILAACIVGCDSPFDICG